MAKKRTEEDKITQAPIVVVLGGKEYPIKPLVIRESSKWRAKMAAFYGHLPAQTQITTDDPVAFEQALGSLMVEMPEALINLFFDYARDLPREEIEATATDSEIMVAFRVVTALAYPFWSALSETLIPTTR